MKKTGIILLFLILFTLLLPIYPTTKAASVSWNAPSSIELGNTITVTVNINAAQWNLKLLVNGATIGNSNEVNNVEGNLSRSFSGTYTPSNTGTVTITLSGDYTDINGDNTEINEQKIVTVNQKTVEPPPSTDPEPPVVSEPNFTSVNQTVYATTEVNVRSSYSTSSGSIGSLQEGDSVTRTGIGDNGWSRVSYNGSTGYIFSQYLTTTAPTVDNEDDNEEDNPVKSSNNYLKSLTVNNGTLSPNFNPRTTSYTVVVEDDLEEITISAEPEDEKATVSGTGTIQLEEGNTTARIEVVAENGSTNTYTIHIRKESAEEIIPVGIKSLKIQGVTVDNKTEDISFMPDFKTEITEYTCNVSDQITKLLITAEPNEEGMTIEILGNENLQMGENVITILVKSEDGQEIYTYQIIVTKGEVAPTSRYGFI